MFVFRFFFFNFIHSVALSVHTTTVKFCHRLFSCAITSTWIPFFGYFGFFLIIIWYLHMYLCSTHIKTHWQHMLTIYRRNDPVTVYIVIICYCNVLLIYTHVKCYIYAICIHMLDYMLFEKHHFATRIRPIIISFKYVYLYNHFDSKHSSSIELILMSTHRIPFIFNWVNVCAYCFVFCFVQMNTYKKMAQMHNIILSNSIEFKWHITIGNECWCWCWRDICNTFQRF